MLHRIVQTIRRGQRLQQILLLPKAPLLMALWLMVLSLSSSQQDQQLGHEVPPSNRYRIRT